MGNQQRQGLAQVKVRINLQRMFRGGPQGMAALQMPDKGRVTGSDGEYLDRSSITQHHGALWQAQFKSLA